MQMGISNRGILAYTYGRYGTLANRFTLLGVGLVLLLTPRLEAQQSAPSSIIGRLASVLPERLRLLMP